MVMSTKQRPRSQSTARFRWHPGFSALGPAPSSVRTVTPSYDAGDPPNRLKTQDFSTFQGLVGGKAGGNGEFGGVLLEAPRASCHSFKLTVTISKIRR